MSKFPTRRIRGKHTDTAEAPEEGLRGERQPIFTEQFFFADGTGLRRNSGRESEGACVHRESSIVCMYSTGQKYVRPSLQNMQQGSRILSPSYCRTCSTCWRVFYSLVGCFRRFFVFFDSNSNLFSISKVCTPILNTDSNPRTQIRNLPDLYERSCNQTSRKAK